MSTREHRIRPRHIVAALILAPIALFLLHWGMLGLKRANIDCTNGATVYFVEWPDFSIEKINGEDSEYSVESVAMTFGNQRAELVGGHFPPGREAS